MRMFTISLLVSGIAVAAVHLLLRRGRRVGLTLALVLVGALVHLGWRATRTGALEGELATAAYLVAVIWSVAAVGTVVTGLPLLAWRGGRGLVRRLRRAPAPVDPSRRLFLGGAAAPAFGLVVSSSGTLSTLRGFEVLQVEIPVPGLPKELDGFRIGQISDVHVGPFIGTDHLREAVEAMNAAGCDLQVMTGDLIDDLDQLDATMEALEACTARHGMLAVLGNHEIWQGEQRVLAAYEESAARGGVRLLLDENLLLDHEGARLRVVGVDYPMHRGGRHRLPPGERQALMERSAERAFAGVGEGEGETVLCLTHHPDFFQIAAGRGAHLTLAGHTHGGQVALLGVPLFRRAYEFMLGGYRLGDAALWVSGGTGHWFPWRLGVPAEVTILTLRSSASRPAPPPARV